MQYFYHILLKHSGKRKDKKQKTTIFVSLFFYTNYGDVMKVYIDIILIVNFLFDLLILSGTRYLLKRKTSFYRIIIASLFGEISIILIFLPLSPISLFLSKLLISIFMLLVAFSYKNYTYFKNNFLYFYLLSIILGGITYFLKTSFRIKSNDLLSNVIVLLLISPYLICKYYIKMREYKININLRHNIDIYINNRKYSYLAYIDTGNRLKDPYKRRPVILVNDKKLKFKYEESILVPFKTLNNSGVVKCMKIDKVVLDNDKVIKNILIGEAKEEFNMDGVDAIMPNIIKEEYYD